MAYPQGKAFNWGGNHTRKRSPEVNYSDLKSGLASLGAGIGAGAAKAQSDAEAAAVAAHNQAISAHIAEKYGSIGGGEDGLPSLPDVAPYAGPGDVSTPDIPAAKISPDAPAPSLSMGTAPSFAGKDGASRSMKMPMAGANPELAASIRKHAEANGLDPVDVATVMSYETAGTLDPWKAGPRTQWGQHRGLIQWGEPQAKQYGVHKDMPVDEQVGAAMRYLKDRGVKPGAGIMDIYSAINAGWVGRNNRTDAHNGGAPGTVADKVNNQMAGHRQKALALLGSPEQQPALPAPVRVASTDPSFVPTPPVRPAGLGEAPTAEAPASPVQRVAQAMQAQPQARPPLPAFQPPPGLGPRPVWEQAAEAAGGPQAPLPTPPAPAPSATERVAQAVQTPRAAAPKGFAIPPDLLQALADPRTSQGTRDVIKVVLQKQFADHQATQKRAWEVQDAGRDQANKDREHLLKVDEFGNTRRKTEWEMKRDLAKIEHDRATLKATIDNNVATIGVARGRLMLDQYDKQHAQAAKTYELALQREDRTLAREKFEHETSKPFLAPLDQDVMRPDGTMVRPGTPKTDVMSPEALAQKKELAAAGRAQTNVTVGGGSDKQVFDTIEKSAEAARAAATGLQSIREARRAVEAGGIFGAGADTRLALQKLGAQLGVADTKGIINTETFRSAIAPQVAALMKATVGSTQISNADREFAEKASGGSISLDPGSIARLLDIMERGSVGILDGHKSRLDAVYPEAEGKFARERALFGVQAPEPPAAPAPAVAPGGGAPAPAATPDRSAIEAEMRRRGLLK